MKEEVKINKNMTVQQKKKNNFIKGTVEWTYDAMVPTARS